MNSVGIVILPIVALVFGVSLWGLLSKRKSVFFAICGILVAVVSLLGAWVAWGETRSVPSTVGYACVALLGIASALRQSSRHGQETDKPE